MYVFENQAKCGYRSGICLGEQLAELPMIDSEGAGEYSVEVDMSAAKSGTYLLRVESIDEFATAMFTVLR